MNARLKGFLWFLFVLLFLTVMFSVVFFLTAWIYKTVGLALPPVVIQAINSVGGLLLAGGAIATIARFFRPKIRAGEMAVFGPIIEALERIAKGDFSVRVDPNIDARSPAQDMVGVLVNSVNQMALELNQMEIMRQEFISNVSHELQSPLTSIQGFARALHGEHLSQEQREHYLAVIEAESTRLSRITENLLKLASLEGEHVKFEPKPYRLDKQIRRLILACEPQWAGKAIDMDVSLGEVVITADEDLLSQVWVNLIHNSIKFTPHGGRICIALQQEGNGIEFKIEDTGIGISEGDQAHIFERFYKADKSRTRSDSGGSGLGLSIVHKIVAMHRGTISVASQLGAGASFTISLPAEQERR